MKRIKWRLIPVLAATAIATAAVVLPDGDAITLGVDPAQTLEANIPVPREVAQILARACRNCHSNQTVMPWYASLPPASWLVARDIAKARAAMNLSTWATGSGRNRAVAAATLAAACADIRSGRMPLPAYRFMHPESRLSPADRRVFCAWANRLTGELLSRSGPSEP